LNHDPSITTSQVAVIKDMSYHTQHIVLVFSGPQTHFAQFKLFRETQNVKRIYYLKLHLNYSTPFICSYLA
jgi:hypothetical protein